jgi:septal ring factor EnvC (AmiA/AmiB activator)
MVSLLASSALALHAAAPEKDLESVKKKIAKEKQGISQAERHETSILKSLETIEGELERKSAELKEAQSKLQSITGEMETKQAEAALQRARHCPVSLAPERQPADDLRRGPLYNQVVAAQALSRGCFALRPRAGHAA